MNTTREEKQKAALTSLLWEIRDLKLEDLARGLTADELTSLTNKLERAAGLASKLERSFVSSRARLVFPEPSDLNLEDLKGAGIL
jgi:hypothetical protein